ncbi:alpha/beta-hydrolase [Athelia psychrophila]|uniref:Dipeptidyl-peptidase V n=1 Tax=Athelia psychrophila TaxID=1759441 RepID=A0A166L3T1_9AGAM|nr:alpha/beta-hydrolase [Fibularhizoctonia sp. CBS 109695]
MSSDYSQLEFARPANQVKTVNVDPIPRRIIDGMKVYEDAARGFQLLGFERIVKDKNDQLTPSHIFLSHRPADAQVPQVYRMAGDPQSTELERVTFFDIGAGRSIPYFLPITGEDWRGVWRPGGAILAMDLDGNECFQLWRYWEDSCSDEALPRIGSELNNSPGTGRFERLTHDEHKYTNLAVSDSNKILLFGSTKENKKDTLIYITKLVDSATGAKADSTPFNLSSRLLTKPTGKGTTHWVVESISIDDRFVLLTKFASASYRPLYIVDISGEEPSDPVLITLPGITEKEEETFYGHASFSLDPALPHLIYLITSAYGDFNSVVAFDTNTRAVSHITTPEPNLHALRPIPWETMDLRVTRDKLFFRANFEGWNQLFVMPLTGAQKDQVIEVKPDWERGAILYRTNAKNGKPDELVLKLISYRSQGWLVRLDIAAALLEVNIDAEGHKFITPSLAQYHQASCVIPPFRTLPPQLIKFKSFDGLEIPVMYYHPKDRQTVVPLVIHIHGGPEGQSTAQTRTPIHGYLLNEMNCAIMYPNVRGSTGYGKTFLAADEVEKREDSVKRVDIGALLEFIESSMVSELNPSRVAVMGGSYGGYMVFACLTHFSPKLTCGVANFGIASWTSFLEHTAPYRRARRRMKYGDETIPEIREFLERISPINNASKITVPLSIAHGETDARVPIGEAIKMWDIVSKNGVYTELMVCEKEGHGFKQKSVIEFVNAAKISFLERFLLSDCKAGL